MNVVGLITEYNPFHNGHLYHIKQAVSLTNADFCIVVMSGNFVQRGAPAIIDKYHRAQMALEAGADLVLELPMPFACGSAEVFAHAAVALLNALGVVTHLCFGSEYTEERILSFLADIFCEEPESFRVALQNSLKKGNSFPKARTNAVLSYLKDRKEHQHSMPSPGVSSVCYNKSMQNEIEIEEKQLQEILSSPNNILGIEYLKALRRLSSSIHPIPIRRIVSSYHSTEIQEEISSATAIRHILEAESTISINDPLNQPLFPLHAITDENSNKYHLLSKAVPNTVLEKLAANYQITTPICSNDFSSILNYCFLTQSSYNQYAEWTDELSNRVNRILPSFYSFEDWAMQLKSKNITHTRICRSLIHLMTKISKEDMQQYKQYNYCLYARVIGFRKDSRLLLSTIKKNTKVPMISKAANAKTILNPIGFHLFEQDVFASRLYNQVVFQKFGTLLPDEYRSNIIQI